MKSYIRVVPELWASSMLPEGIVEKWLMPDGAYVETGDPVATVRIEDALHEILAPATGWLSTDVNVNAIIDPGASIGHIGS